MLDAMQVEVFDATSAEDRNVTLASLPHTTVVVSHVRAESGIHEANPTEKRGAGQTENRWAGHRPFRSGSERRRRYRDISDGDPKTHRR